ncbi:MAG: Fic family protein [Acidimicrobiales bacterium]|nr:Fic family protein [Acidimicrobiales bacterium]
MDLNRFKDSPIGYLVEFSGTDPRTHRTFSHKAYVPNPLPLDLELRRGTVNSLSDAMLALGRLDQALSWIANPMLYIRQAVRREAVSTSALEGTFAAFEDVLGADVLETEKYDPNLHEVLNFVRAAEQALAWIQERPITRALISELQRILVRGTGSDGPEAGRIRTTPVLIGPKGCAVEAARFIPPLPGHSLAIGVREWEEWCERDGDLPLLVKVAMAHYQFETLHPFTDGNGRIGRLVSLLQLVRAGALRYPMLNISTWLYERREEYVDHLLTISESGDFNPWIQFFCKAVTDEARSAVDRITAAQEWRERLLVEIKDKRIKSLTVHQLADGLIGHPVVTATWVQNHYSVSFPTASSAIAKLTELGFLREMTGRNYGRTFAAMDLLRIFQV